MKEVTRMASTIEEDRVWMETVSPKKTPLSSPIKFGSPHRLSRFSFDNSLKEESSHSTLKDDTLTEYSRTPKRKKDESDEENSEKEVEEVPLDKHKNMNGKRKDDSPNDDSPTKRKVCI